MTHEKSQTSSPKAEDIKKEQTETPSDSKFSAERWALNPRRTGLSKREIMEELSRQRFPWDE